MKFPIDVVILDDKGRVQALFENLKPWRVAVWNPKHSRVLELQKGTILKKNIKLQTKVGIIS